MPFNLSLHIRYLLCNDYDHDCDEQETEMEKAVHVAS